jgi:hypothetical protein
MDHIKTFSSALAAGLVAASLAIVMPTSALGACKTTLRGELVQAAVPRQAFPLKFLFFWLSETTQDNGTSAEKRFQSFVVPNTRSTLPIPFALDIDSPKDCPSELKLSVSTYDTDRMPSFSFGDFQLRGEKMVRPDRFESIPVWGPTF